MEKMDPEAVHIQRQNDGEFEQWAILEVMGHRRLGGLVTEQTIAGTGWLRIDVPNEDGSFKATQFYRPNSIYALTPTTEEIARKMAKSSQVKPVSRWELEYENTGPTTM